MDIILRVKSKADESVQSVRQPVNGRMVLGRGPDSAVPLEAPGISRDHLEVQVEDSALFLTDMSSNGTWINGARMPQGRKCKVKEDDFVELPGYEIQFQLVDAKAVPAIPVALPAAGSSKGLRGASAASGAPARSLGASFSGLELFLLAVGLACAALLVLYLTL